jgi:hypothetical protein
MYDTNYIYRVHCHRVVSGGPARPRLQLKLGIGAEHPSYSVFLSRRLVPSMPARCWRRDSKKSDCNTLAHAHRQETETSPPQVTLTRFALERDELHPVERVLGVVYLGIA